MGKRSRVKGQRGERELVHLLRAAFVRLTGIRRGDQSRSGRDECDVEGTPWWIESKLGKRPNVRAAMAQAVSDTDGRPPVVLTRRDREEWLVTMRLSDFVRLTRPRTEAHAGPAATETATGS